MGHESLQHPQWSTEPTATTNLLFWDGVDGRDSALVDHLRFALEMVALRVDRQDLRSGNVRAFYYSDSDTSLAYHRWLNGLGKDVLKVASLAAPT
jgi:1,4-alpha-glucan branching enzyme